MAGMHWLWFPALGGFAVTAAGLAYKFAPHVRARIQQFMNPGDGGGAVDTFQVETAHDALVSGGWFGKGPGEGTFKQILPDSHTDFIFAVTGEEFGLVFCMALVALFAFIVLRGLMKAAAPTTRFAASPRRGSPCCSASRPRSTWR